MLARVSHDSLDYFCDFVISLHCAEYLQHPLAKILNFYTKPTKKSTIFLECSVVLIAHILFNEIIQPGCVGNIWEVISNTTRSCVKRWLHKIRGDGMLTVVPLSSNNDMNILNQSPLFLAKQNGIVPKCPMHVHSWLYKRGYYLTDEIYPTWSMFVKSTPYPTDPKEKKI